MVLIVLPGPSDSDDWDLIGLLNHIQFRGVFCLDKYLPVFPESMNNNDISIDQHDLFIICPNN